MCLHSKPVKQTHYKAFILKGDRRTAVSFLPVILVFPFLYLGPETAYTQDFLNFLSPYMLTN
jgi:hypothetical protein